MFAIVDIQGNQHKVQEGDVIQVAHLDNEEGDKLSFDKVMLIGKSEKDTVVGTPYVEGASVEAQFVADTKGKKIRVFKMKSKNVIVLHKDIDKNIVKSKSLQLKKKLLRRLMQLKLRKKRLQKKKNNNYCNSSDDSSASKQSWSFFTNGASKDFSSPDGITNLNFAACKNMVSRLKCSLKYLLALLSP